jgi:hypothetical protein
MQPLVDPVDVKNKKIENVPYKKCWVYKKSKKRKKRKQ